MRLVLASASPQRRGLLADAGYRFEVLVADVEELTVGDPAGVAERNAVAKAEAVALRVGESVDDSLAAVVVLGADTVVAMDGQLFGKPDDRQHAAEMLSRLSGREHEVHTGVAVVAGGVTRSAVATTAVRFTELDTDAIALHVGLGEWEGRAGGYAIQESAGELVTGLDGDLDTVIGLPIRVVESLLPDAVQRESGR